MNADIIDKLEYLATQTENRVGRHPDVDTIRQAMAVIGRLAAALEAKAEKPQTGRSKKAPKESDTTDSEE